MKEDSSRPTKRNKFCFFEVSSNQLDGTTEQRNNSTLFFTPEMPLSFLIIAILSGALVHDDIGSSFFSGGPVL